MGKHLKFFSQNQLLTMLGTPQRPECTDHPDSSSDAFWNICTFPSRARKIYIPIWDSQLPANNKEHKILYLLITWMLFCNSSMFPWVIPELHGEIILAPAFGKTLGCSCNSSWNSISSTYAFFIKGMMAMTTSIRGRNRQNQMIPGSWGNLAYPWNMIQQDHRNKVPKSIQKTGMKLY